MEILEDISVKLQKGNAPEVVSLVTQALEDGVDASSILNDGLLSGMNIIGGKFKRNEVFVPEVLIAARAMNMGVVVLKPYLAGEAAEKKGKVVLGTVKGDLHDIGKNLVKIMMEGRGLEVIDLGTDVSADQFISAVIENEAQVIACSALLTTTMPEMENVVKAAVSAGIRDKVKIMVGGAPVTSQFSESIAADSYTADAVSAAETALSYCVM